MNVLSESVSNMGRFKQLSQTKEELANLCAKSERYIGTEGGGMDQAIAFLACKGTV